MRSRPTEELLYESEAALRLVDTVLDELGGMEASTERPRSRPAPDAADLPQVLLRTHDEIRNVLESLRQSRSVLERTLHHTDDRRDDGAPAGGPTTGDVFAGLDRALTLIERLDVESFERPDQRTEVHAELRNEIFEAMGSLQFRDSTTQRLGYAMSVLLELEARLAELGRVVGTGTVRPGAVRGDEERCGAATATPPEAADG